MRIRRNVLRAAVGALVVGVLATGTAACDSGSDDGGGDDAAKDAKAACRLLDRLPERMPESPENTADAAGSAAYDAATNRYAAAGMLARAAAAADPAYRPLADALDRGGNEMSAAFDVHALDRAAEQARTHC